jgi:hypothetical protein
MGGRKADRAAISKKRGIYQLRTAGGHDAGDLQRVHKELLEFERIHFGSDKVRAVIQAGRTRLVHKLPPKETH